MILLHTKEKKRSGLKARHSTLFFMWKINQMRKEDKQKKGRCQSMTVGIGTMCRNQNKQNLNFNYTRHSQFPRMISQKGSCQSSFSSSFISIELAEFKTS